jgi:hypothetical protein
MYAAITNTPACVNAPVAVGGFYPMYVIGIRHYCVL